MRCNLTEYVGSRYRLVAFFCLLVGCTHTIAETHAERWMLKNLGEKESIACMRSVRGEYFFVSVGRDNVRVASRLDVTRFVDTHSVSIDWNFRDELDNNLVAEIAPRPIRYKNVIDEEGRVFTEALEYQWLSLGRAREVLVTVEITKCAALDCESKNSPQYEHYVVPVCKVNPSVLRGNKNR